MLDIARFLGMFLVYFGHVVEQFMYLGNAQAGLYYKFIYSFHMPFFIILAGFVHNPEKLKQPLSAFASRTAASRLIPYATFSLLMLVSTLFITGWFPAGGPGTLQNYIDGIFSTLRGLPVYNIPTWFMAMLVATEVLHYLVGRFLTSYLRLAAAIAAFYLGGYWLNSEVQFLFRPDGLDLNFWFINQAVTMYAFYLIGVLMRRRGLFLNCNAKPGLLLAAGACLALVLFTFNLNIGPWRLIPAVVVMLGGYGNIILFPITAIAGSIMLMLIGKAWDRCGWAAWLGKHTIILFCLNGVFYHYMNQRFAKWCTEAFDLSWTSTGLLCLGASVASMALCIPAIILFTRFFPQLIGRPSQSGPILPALIRS